jgi:hypothetical protein
MNSESDSATGCLARARVDEFDFLVSRLEREVFVDTELALSENGR